LPEINNPDVGWMIDLPQSGTGEAEWRSTEGRERISRAIEEQLVDHLEHIIGSPDMIRRKGEAALDRIRTHHSPLSRAAALEELYRSAIDKARR
jgi:hypothetical protein